MKASKCGMCPTTCGDKNAREGSKITLNLCITLSAPPQGGWDTPKEVEAEQEVAAKSKGWLFYVN